MSRIILCFSKYEPNTISELIASYKATGLVEGMSVNPPSYNGFSEFDALYSGQFHPMIALFVSQSAKQGRKLGPQILKHMSHIKSVVALKTNIDVEGAGSNLSLSAKKTLYNVMGDLDSVFLDWGGFNIESRDQVMGSSADAQEVQESLESTLDDKLKILRRNLEKATSNIYCADELRAWFHNLLGDQKLIVGRIVEFGTLNTVELLENRENLSVKSALDLVERSIGELANITGQKQVS